MNFEKYLKPYNALGINFPLKGKAVTSIQWTGVPCNQKNLMTSNHKGNRTQNM